MERFVFLLVCLLAADRASADCYTEEYCTTNGACDRGDTLYSTPPGCRGGLCCLDNRPFRDIEECNVGEECTGNCSAQIIDHPDTRRCEYNKGADWYVGKCCPLPCPVSTECKHHENCGDNPLPSQKCYLNSGVTGYCCSKEESPVYHNCGQGERCVLQHVCTQTDRSQPLPCRRNDGSAGVCCRFPPCQPHLECKSECAAGISTQQPRCTKENGHGGFCCPGCSSGQECVPEGSCGDRRLKRERCGSVFGYVCCAGGVFYS